MKYTKKLIIAGGRDFKNYTLLEQETLNFLKDNDIQIQELSIVSGKARGADALGERFAKKFEIPVIEMPAEWDKYGKSAGYKRNEAMADVATHCICFWDGESRGTGAMIRTARNKGLVSRTVKYQKDNQKLNRDFSEPEP